MKYISKSPETNTAFYGPELSSFSIYYLIQKSSHAKLIEDTKVMQNIYLPFLNKVKNHILVNFEIQNAWRNRYQNQTPCLLINNSNEKKALLTLIDLTD